MPRTGDICQTSGIYTVINHIEHPREITMVKGKEFPPCTQCSQRVRISFEGSDQALREHEGRREKGRNPFSRASNLSRYVYVRLTEKDIFRDIFGSKPGHLQTRISGRPKTILAWAGATL